MSKDRKPPPTRLRAGQAETVDQRPKRILIVRLDKIGDVILSTPAIKALRDAYPTSHIAFMVRPYAREIVEGNPYLDEVIIYDKEHYRNGIRGNLKFILALRRGRFDIALILHPTARAHMITFLAGIPERVGYDRKWGCLLTKRIPHGKQFGLKHEIDYTLDILRYIGIEARERRLYMPVKESSEYKMEGLFERRGIKDSDVVITLNPGASCSSKRWRPENFALVGDALIESVRDARIVIISNLKDKAFGDKVARLMKKGCMNLSGRTSVADVASVLKRSKLFISNDSGPVHIACAVGTPVVAIFGRSDRGLSPERWAPSGKTDIVLHKYVGCKKCLAHNCRIGYKCLEAITADEVVAAAKKILGQ